MFGGARCFNAMDRSRLMKICRFVEEPLDICGTRCKEAKAKRIAHIQSSLELIGRAEYTWERRRPIPKNIRIFSPNPLPFVKCRNLSLEDKAHLTGKDCNQQMRPRYPSREPVERISAIVRLSAILVLLLRDKNKVCLLCEVILKQIPAFDFFCASLETISAIEDTWEREEVWEDIQVVLVFGRKIAFGEVGRLVPLKLYNFKSILPRLEEALKEKYDLKLKLEKFEESSNNLTKLIDSAKDKTGLGYDSQMNKSEVVHSVFNSRESDVDDSPVNDRFKTGEGFHAVPPPYTGNYMPSRPDLSFVGLDDSVYKTKVSETETSISKTSKDIVEKPKTVRPSAPIIEEWDTDSDNDSVFRPKSDQTKPKFTKINFQIAVATKSGQVPVNAAKQSSPRAATSINSSLMLGSPKRKLNSLILSGTIIKEMMVDLLHLCEAPKGCKIHQEKKNSVLFTETECLVLSPDFKLLDESQVLLKVPRQNNMYSFDLKNVVPSGGLTCLFAKATIDESNLWHRRLGHINFKTMNKLVRGNLVRGLPSKLFENDHTCVACQKGKQHKASCKTKLDETSRILKTFITGIENQINHKVKIIRCDNGTEFKNNDMNQFCGMKGIKKEFSVARTPQQNGVAERKNRKLIKAARTMLTDSLLPTTFWGEAVSTACYVQNRVLVIKPHNKTPYELLHGRPPSISFMRPFGCPMTILNTLDPLGKFDRKADEGFFIRYSINSKGLGVCKFDAQEVPDKFYGGAYFLLKVLSHPDR
ncbi:putative ribonuclease H-like domain-containing protein [Tanacetum coccineum]|uniref:Ribonuclease H-like domain-containing protein n=1 Tax=Tanacetum coccineum TaxID=301880 RepID=A0ABQ5J3E6_9ASTR